MEVKFVAARFIAWSGSNAGPFLSWEELGPHRDTPEAAEEDRRAAPPQRLVPDDRAHEERTVVIAEFPRRDGEDLE